MGSCSSLASHLQVLPRWSAAVDVENTLALKLMTTDQLNRRERFVGSEHPDQNSDAKHRDQGEDAVSRHGSQYLPPTSSAWLLKKLTLPLSVTLSSLDHEAIAPVWGGVENARQTTRSRYRGHSLLAGWIFKMGMGDVGVRFEVTHKIHH